MISNADRAQPSIRFHGRNLTQPDRSGSAPQQGPNASIACGELLQLATDRTGSATAAMTARCASGTLRCVAQSLTRRQTRLWAFMSGQYRRGLLILLAVWIGQQRD